MQRDGSEFSENTYSIAAILAGVSDHMDIFSFRHKSKIHHVHALRDSFQFRPCLLDLLLDLLDSDVRVCNCLRVHALHDSVWELANLYSFTHIPAITYRPKGLSFP